MATFLARLQARADVLTAETITGIDLLTPEEGRTLFERRVQELLHISGEEFLRRWDAGMYQPVPDNDEGRRIGELVMMMPFARRTKS